MLGRRRGGPPTRSPCERAPAGRPGRPGSRARWPGCFYACQVRARSGNRGEPAAGLEQPEQVTGEVALEAALDLARGSCPRRCAGRRRRGCRGRAAGATRTIVCSARLSWRSPPRFRRWRIVWPEEAGIGAAPPAWRRRPRSGAGPRCDQAIRSWAAVIGPTPGSASSCGRRSRDQLARSGSRGRRLRPRAPGPVGPWRAGRRRWRGARRLGAGGAQPCAAREQLAVVRRRSWSRSGAGALTISALSWPIACVRATHRAPRVVEQGTRRASRAPRGARLGQVLARERLAGGARRRRGRRTSRRAASGALGPVDLDDPLAAASSRYGRQARRRSCRCPRSPRPAGRGRARAPKRSSRR